MKAVHEQRAVDRRLRALGLLVVLDDSYATAAPVGVVCAEPGA